MASRYLISGLQWGATVLAGVTGQAINRGRQTRATAGSGSHHVRFVTATRYQQQIRAQTRAIATLWGKMIASGTYGVPCQTLDSATNKLTLAAQAIDDILPGATATASDDETLVISKGLATITGLSWGGPGEGVEAELLVIPISADGTTDPITQAAGTIPTIPAAEEDYELLSATWNSIALDGISNLKLSMETAPEPIFNPGKIYPQKIAQRPATGPIPTSASFTLPDRSYLRAWGPHFQSGALASLVLQLAPYTQAETIGTVGLTLTLTGALEVTDAQDGRPGSVNCLVHGVSSNGTTPPLTWA